MFGGARALGLAPAGAGSAFPAAAGIAGTESWVSSGSSPEPGEARCSLSEVRSGVMSGEDLMSAALGWV